MVSKRIVLTFPHKLLDEPIVYKLVKDYDLVFNILQAKITPKEEGLMVLELKGKKENYAEGIKYLTGLGVKIQPLSQDVTRDDSRCTHCGACIAVCPSVGHTAMQAPQCVHLESSLVTSWLSGCILTPSPVRYFIPSA